MSSNRLARYAAPAYLGVVAIATAIAVGSSEALSGVYAVALTLPWSLVSVAILDGIDHTLLDNTLVGAATIMVGGLLNAAIIHVLTRARRSRTVEPAS